MDSGDRSHDMTVFSTPLGPLGSLYHHTSVVDGWCEASFWLGDANLPLQSLHCGPMGWTGWIDSQGKASSDVIPLSLRRTAAVIQPQSSPGRTP